MDTYKLWCLKGFYENELTGNILPFWMERCEDKEFGGYFNCYDNLGLNRVSTDKYTWSQGRFVWTFSRLARMDKLFFDKQRSRFLELAENGANFLMDHCLLEGSWCCTFLMDQEGNPKKLEGWERYDMSIYADCFVVAGLAQYAIASGNEKPYAFAKNLYSSIVARIEEGSFFTLPYPLSPEYRAHGIPMILSNLSADMYRAALLFDKDFIPALLERLEGYASDILTHFTDENGMIHEVITAENSFMPNLLGQHANPGHSIEDAWFLLDAAEILGKSEWIPAIDRMVSHTLEIGWDEEMGGILHYCSPAGGEPTGDVCGVEKEPMLGQVQNGWGDKLWWVHSEALYTTLRCYLERGDENFLKWHARLFEYVFRVFPNPDREVREWIQILTREGCPQNKTVALPVKDPYHIIRNLILIIEAIEKHLA